MLALPLTHHEIIERDEPFLRQRPHIDLAASDGQRPMGGLRRGRFVVA